MSDPIVIPAVPTPVPSVMDPENFDVRADALLAALPGVVAGQNAQNAQNNALHQEVTEARDELMAAGLASAAANASTATTQAAASHGHANSALAHKDAAAASASSAAASATGAATAATAAATTLISAVTQRPSIKPCISVDWTLKPTAAALAAAGWTVSRTGEITSFGPAQHKAAENLFVRSRNFADAAWTKTALAALGAVTHSSGIVGSTVAADATAAAHALLMNYAAGAFLPSQQYRIRFLVKAGAYSKCIVSDVTSGRAAAAFDLAGGTTVASTNGAGYISHSITPHELGGGLYVVELRMTTAASGAWAPGIVGYPDGASLSVNGATYAGNGTSGIEVYAAQLIHVHETDYDCDFVDTTGTAVTLWTPKLVTTASNELAYQHTARGECLGLVNYPAATNVCLRSQDLGNAAWSKTGLAATQTKRLWAGVVPFFRLSKTDNTSSKAATNNCFTPSAGSTWSASIALLADGWTATNSADVALDGVESGGTWGANSDATAAILSGPGTLTRVTGTLYRITELSTTTPTLVRVTRTYPIAESGGRRVYIYPATSSSTTNGAAILATRVQVESGPRATPYIPTTSATVTRGAQTVVMSGTSFAALANPAEGTLLARASVEDAVWDQSRSLLAASPSSSGSFRCAIEMQNSTSGRMMGYEVTGGVAQALLNSLTNEVSATPKTFAFAYAENFAQYSSEGQITAADTVGTVPPMDRLSIGQSWAGLVQRSDLYPRAMTAAELTAITTPGVLQ